MDKRTLLVVALVAVLTAAGGVAFFVFGGAGAALGGAAGSVGALGEEEPIAVSGSASAAVPACDEEPCVADDEPGAAGAAADATAPEAFKTSGALSPSQIGMVVKSKIARVQTCYERALKSDPELEGKVVVTVAVDGAGKARAEVRDDGLAPATVAACVAGTLARLKYPASGGGEVAAVFPFVFSPSK
jgi:hypothetical protein